MVHSRLPPWRRDNPFPPSCNRGSVGWLYGGCTQSRRTDSLQHRFHTVKRPPREPRIQRYFLQEDPALPVDCVLVGYTDTRTSGSRRTCRQSSRTSRWRSPGVARMRLRVPVPETPEIHLPPHRCCLRPHPHGGIRAPLGLSPSLLLFSGVPLSVSNAHVHMYIYIYIYMHASKGVWHVWMTGR